MIDLKNVFAAAVAILALVGPATAENYEPEINDDGLYTQSWFLQSFLDLGEDLQEAAAGGKNFAIIWEQKGCPYCKELHLTNFADDEVRGFVRDNFEVVQLNIWGAREVTDFDGAVLSEKELARKSGVRFTPTIQFYAAAQAGNGAPATPITEVARMPGYLRAEPFLAMFRYVDDGSYQRMDFRRYLASQQPPTE